MSASTPPTARRPLVIAVIVFGVLTLGYTGWLISQEGRLTSGIALQGGLALAFLCSGLGQLLPPNKPAGTWLTVAGFVLFLASVVAWMTLPD